MGCWLEVAEAARGELEGDVRLDRPDVWEPKIAQVTPMELQPGGTVIVDLEVVPGRTLTATDLRRPATMVCSLSM
jgi:hypothetical protein